MRLTWYGYGNARLAHPPALVVCHATHAKTRSRKPNRAVPSVCAKRRSVSDLGKFWKLLCCWGFFANAACGVWHFRELKDSLKGFLGTELTVIFPAHSFPN